MSWRKRGVPSILTRTHNSKLKPGSDPLSPVLTGDSLPVGMEHRAGCDLKGLSGSFG